jgi:hypothetical protein
MRYVCAAAAIALSVLIPSGASAQAPVLSITNYQLVSEQRVTRTVYDLSYRADLVNNGPARAAVTATVTSSVPSTQVMQGSLHFANVPANGRVTSSDTFTIRVDRTVAFDFANLQWTFPPDAAPVADAGPDQTAPVGATVTLNGSGSTNPGGVGTLTYSWAFISRPAGSTAVLSNPASVMPTFVIDVPGAYMIRLTVSNGLASDTDSVTVNTSNTPPVAHAGPDQTVAAGATVTLNGSGSTDADGNPLTYSWTLTQRPAGSTAALTGANSVSPTFVADKAGIYVARLVVNDGQANSAPDTVQITTTNTAPVANAGPDQTVSVGAVVQLNGSASTDANGDPLTYQWTLTTRPAGSTAVLSSTTAVNPTFTADRPGNYVAQLVVHDGTVASAADTVQITTGDVLAPTANAGLDQTVKHGSLVQLTGSGTDPQGLPLTFQWSLLSKPAGSTAVLSSTTVANPTFTADRPGDYIAQLIVNNGFQSSPPDTVKITTTNTAPVANAGPDQNAAAGATVNLNGAGSSDADGDPITFAWSFTTRPAGSSAALSGANSPTPTFVPDVAGMYVAQLIVSDAFASSAPDTVTINVAAGAPAAIAATSGSGQSTAINTAFTDPLIVTVTDAGGNPVSGVTVTFTAPASGASGVFTGGNTGVTGPLGRVAKTFTANSTAGGPYNVTATVAGVATPATFSLTNTQGQPGSITATSGSGQSAQVNTAFTNLLVATVRDAGGNPVSGVTVTFTAPASGAGATFTGGNTAVTNASGVASKAVTANSIAGSYNVTASAPGVATPATFSLTNTAGAAASIEATSGSGQSAQINTAFTNPLVVTVRDADGNPVSGVTVTFTAPASGASGTFGGGNTGVTNASGVVSKVFTANGTAGGPYNVTAAAAGVATPATFSLTNTAGTAASVEATSGSGQSAQINTAFTSPLVVTVRDAGGNPVSGVTVTFTAPASGASGTFGGGNTGVTNASGVVSKVFTANGTAGGPYNVTATVPGVATPATFSLTNTAGAAATIEVTGGSGQSAQIGTAFTNPLVATVKDADGNPVSGVTVTFTAPASGASGTFSGGNTGVTGPLGTVSKVFTANTTAGGPYNVTAAAAGVATPATFSLTNTAGPAATIEVTGGSGQSAQINSAFANPLVATVKDASGNPVGGVTVTFTAPASGASGTFTGGNTAVTGPLGNVSKVFTANGTAGGPYNVTAAAAGVATPATFSLTNTAGPAASITATSGSGQSTNVNTPFTNPLVATVRDAGGNPVSGVTVTFAAPASGASVVFGGGATGVTGALGTVSKTVTANGIAGGPYNVTASVAGVGTPAAFSLTNTPVVGPPLMITGATVGRNLQTTVSVSLPTAAPPGGRDVTITSANAAQALLASAPTAAGAVQITVNVPQGQTTLSNIYVHGMANSGTVQITASAAGFQNGTATVSLTPSGFILSGPAGIGVSSFNAPQGSNTQLTITAAQLDSSLNYVSTQAVRGGLSPSVTVSNSTPAVGTVSPSPVTVAAGASTATTTFNALTPGATLLTAAAPPGFSVPPGLNTLVAIVVSTLPIAPTVTVGENLETTAQIRVNTAPPAATPVTVTSNDPSKLLFSLTPEAAGQASIALSIAPGLLATPVFYVHGLANTGSATYTADVDGYGISTGTVNFAPSGFIIEEPAFNFLTTVGAPNIDITVVPYRLSAGLAPAAAQAVRGGLVINVPVTSSTPAVGVITTSPVVFNGGAASGSTQFDPLTNGSTTIALGTPTGFSTPSSDTSRLATVITPSISLTQDLTVGRNLQASGTVILGQPAPPGGIQVQITSNSGDLLLASSPTAAGAASIMISIPEGMFSALYYLHALADSGTATYTASAPGYSPRTVSMFMARSGVVISGEFGFGFPLATTINAPPQPVLLYTYRLDAGNAPLEPQALAGGLTLSVDLENSNPGVGSVTSPVIITGGNGTPESPGMGQFTPLSLGSTVLSVETPAGYTQPTLNTTLTVVVSAP